MGYGKNGHQIRIRRIEKIRMDKWSAHMHVISRLFIQKCVFTRLVKLVLTDSLHNQTQAGILQHKTCFIDDNNDDAA